MTKSTQQAAPKSRWRLYVRMARPDHWVKHLFILPGIALALILAPRDAAPLAISLTAGLVAAAFAASANYVLNEWLDADFDRHHPLKSARSAAQEKLSPRIVWALYVSLTASALALAAIPSKLFWLSILLLIASGWIYNIPPIRTKDVPYLDVLSEAINNPIRLFLGWSMVSGTTLPPSSLIVGYWMTGAFLMGVKRLAEYRTLAASVGTEAAERYRRSFGWYTESRLLVSVFLYAQLAAFFLAVFLIKYRIEYLITLPVFALWFASYIRIGLKTNSPAQAPERLFREPLLFALSVLLVTLLLVLTWIDLPILDELTTPHFIRLLPDASAAASMPPAAWFVRS